MRTQGGHTHLGQRALVVVGDGRLAARRTPRLVQAGQVVVEVVVGLVGAVVGPVLVVQLPDGRQTPVHGAAGRVLLLALVLGRSVLLGHSILRGRGGRWTAANRANEIPKIK